MLSHIQSSFFYLFRRQDSFLFSHFLVDIEVADLAHESRIPLIILVANHAVSNLTQVEVGILNQISLRNSGDLLIESTGLFDGISARSWLP